MDICKIFSSEQRPQHIVLTTVIGIHRQITSICFFLRLRKHGKQYRNQMFKHGQILCWTQCKSLCRQMNAGKNVCWFDFGAASRVLLKIFSVLLKRVYVNCLMKSRHKWDKISRLLEDITSIKVVPVNHLSIWVFKLKWSVFHIRILQFKHLLILIYMFSLFKSITNLSTMHAMQCV